MLLETFDEALVEAVRACGGSKVVGVALWPSKGVEVAQRGLLNALNPDRPEKLSTDEIVHIARLARDRDCHVVMEFLTNALGYAPPQPIAPRDEFAALMRQHNELLKESMTLATRLEGLMRGPALKAVNTKQSST